MKNLIWVLALCATPVVAQITTYKKAPIAKGPPPPPSSSAKAPTSQVQRLKQKAAPTPKALPSNQTVQPDQPVNTDNNAGNWSTKTIVDLMSDATRGIAMTSVNENIVLVVKCDSNGNDSVYFSFIAKEFLGAGAQSDRMFTYRIDGGASRVMWASHDNSSATVLNLATVNFLSGDVGRKFLKDLNTASRLAVRLYTYESEAYESVIQVVGAKEAFNYVAKTCKDASLEQYLNN